jgi:hypothetical protein
VNLREAGVGKVGAPLVRPPDRRGVAAFGVGGEVEGVAVAARGQHHDVGQARLDLAGAHVAHDDAARAPVDDDHVQHLGAVVHLDRLGRNLPRQRLVGAEQQLLTSLPPGVEGARHLRAAKGAVVQHAAVLAGKGHALGHALVDDGVAHLGQAIDIGLAGAEVAALDRVVKETVDAVAVVAIVLGRVDAALCGHAVGAARAVLIGVALDVVALLAQRSCRRRAGQPGADDDDIELAPVRRIDQLHVEARLVPDLFDGAGRHLAVQRGFGEDGKGRGGRRRRSCCICPHGNLTPHPF